MKTVNLEKLQKLVDEKLISVQKHKDADLYIWNYTQKCQFGKAWTEETLMCRGLITDFSGKIIARPFKKFFNFGEDVKVFPLNESYVVQEKFDGSLGILYWLSNVPYLATRGSFESQQAIEGTKILQEFLAKNNIDALNKNFTYLFEIIFPENRIVVNYGKKRKIILLAIIETETGREIPVEDTTACGFEYAPYIKIDINKVEEKENAEGYVVNFEKTGRVKLKFKEYVRLHRLVTGVNKRTIWDFLKNEQSFEELLEKVPDEFYAWIKQTQKELRKQFSSISKKTQRALASTRRYSNIRKEQAEYVFKKHKQYSGIIFKMLDGQPHEELIWRMIRPSAEKPFKEEV